MSEADESGAGDPRTGEPAWTGFFATPEGHDRVLACGGTDDDPHMVEMEMNYDAATPHGVCPKCGQRAFLTPKERDFDVE